MGESGIRSAQVLRYIRMAFGEAFEMGFIDDRLMQRPVGRAIAGPIEMRMVDHRLEYVLGAVLDVDNSRVRRVVRVAGGIPVNVPVDRSCVRIEQEFAWI